MVSVAGAQNSLITVKYAIYLSKLLGATLTAVYVVDQKVISDLIKRKVFVEAEAREYEKDLEEQGMRFLERIAKMAQSKGVRSEVLLLKGIVNERITDAAADLDADLLIIGELKERVSTRRVFYDEGERIFWGAPCPVVVAKNPGKIERLYQEL